MGGAGHFHVIVGKEKRPISMEKGKHKMLTVIQRKVEKYKQLEVLGPFGARLLGCGPSGLLDVVLRALRPLRPCDPRNGAMIG